MTNGDLFTMNGASLVTKAQGAFLAAAIGDALGWPQEDRSNRVDKPTGSVRGLPLTDFQRWKRRSGGRFYPHEELILAGEYSDDTQLLLCTARSLLHGTQWWHHLTRRELPSWSLYERGGGRATMHAAGMWLAGREPWSSTEKADRKHYFEAGGNGVAMRIMPHCLFGVAEKDFSAVATNILANGVCTHGHPRALIGALAYGFAVWMAFRETETLQYGAIIEKVLAAMEFWSALPDLGGICPTWRPSTQEEHAGQYEKCWQETAAEMMRLLERCREAMKQGALSIDQEVLKQLGCFDRGINGSGTVAAAASIFLASRYAADPFHGLIEAAFSYGADTDTIASMTGGLLGAVLGGEWLENRSEQVQDASYLKVIAERLAKKTDVPLDTSLPIYSVTKADINSFFAKLEAAKPNDAVLFPDRREVVASAPQPHKMRSKTALAVSWKLISDDGQSLYVKKISRGKAEIDPKVKERLETLSDARSAAQLQPVEILRLGVKLPVRDVAKARLFYEKALGLKVAKESKSLVNFESGIVLIPVDYEQGIEKEPREFTVKSATLSFKTGSLEAAYNNVGKVGATILTPLSQLHGQRFFRCLDPDGNVIELSERT